MRPANDQTTVPKTRGFKPVNKYRAKRTNGYSSKREAEYAQKLTFLKNAGVIRDWLEQVPVKLPGGSKYVVDFMVINPDGTIRFVEIKGFETPVFKLKLGLLEASRPEIFARLEIVR